MAAKRPTQRLLELAEGFVVKHNGSWNHEAWETFLVDASKLGVEINDETKRNLGNILENTKFFFTSLKGTARKEKKTAKTKSGAKTKAKRKTKAKATTKVKTKTRAKAKAKTKKS